MATRFEIGPDAYYKIVYHAAKHPHAPVNGVLLGSASSSTVTISDAVPLLHHWTSLSPMMEIGLDLTTQYARESGLKVVGYYQAPQRIDDVGLGPVGEKVASKIKAGFVDTVAFVIDGKKLGKGEPALIPYTLSGSTWKLAEPEIAPFSDKSHFKLSPSNIPSEAQKLVEKQLHLIFGDFDDHLEDVSIDWLRNRACLP